MADSFERPVDQASLDALRTQLAQTGTGITAQIQAMGTRLQEAQRSETARARQAPVAGRSTATVVPELRQEVEAVQAQVVSYERLNALIAQRIELEKKAASTVSTARNTQRAAGATAAPAVIAGVTGSSGASLDV